MLLSIINATNVTASYPLKKKKAKLANVMLCIFYQNIEKLGLFQAALIRGFGFHWTETGPAQNLERRAGRPAGAV